jgi:hypothetical protein
MNRREERSAHVNGIEMLYSVKERGKIKVEKLISLISDPFKSVSYGEVDCEQEVN